jgi:hypothetical protein|tara:strand:- start:958 stop:1125 length:168 start_codon:yes stop_codon:yes gene_type:complete
MAKEIDYRKEKIEPDYNDNSDSILSPRERNELTKILLTGIEISEGAGDLQTITGS